MEKHFATDEKSWGSNPYGTSVKDKGVSPNVRVRKVVRFHILLWGD